MNLRKTSTRGLLLVSNDKALRRQLRTCLLALGLTPSALTMVGGGRACVETLGRVRPRLIVLDDALSDVTGPALLRALHEQNPEALVLYLTTHHTLDLERAVRQLGVLYYTEKPLETALLYKVLRAVLTAEQPSAGALSRQGRRRHPRVPPRWALR